MRWLVFFVKFVFLAAFFIISNGNLHLSAVDDRQIFFDEYTGWTFNVISSVGDLTGYVVQVEWLPDSDTIESSPSSDKDDKTVRSFGNRR